MDELEFRKRVYANPQQVDQETQSAARENPALQKILDQAKNLDDEVITLTSNIEVPEGLADRLRAIPVQAGGNHQAASRPASNNIFQYYALAASLILALGIGAAVGLNGNGNANDGPSSTEMAFGSNVIQHLYHEINEISAINSGTDVASMTMPAVIQVMASAETHFTNDDFLQSMPVRFAKPCIILPTYKSAHLMVQGNQGAVNVIVINNSPVAGEFKIRDDRFNGLVIPMSDGNLILVGEKDENLDQYKATFSQNVEWSI